jgi:hypothetical protein
LGIDTEIGDYMAEKGVSKKCEVCGYPLAAHSRDDITGEPIPCNSEVGSFKDALKSPIFDPILGDRKSSKSQEFLKRFKQLVDEELALVEAKNNDYAGEKAADPFGNFNRVSKILAMYPGLKLSDPVVVGIVYMLKQLDSVLNGLSTGTEMKVEGYDKRFQDLGIYPKLLSVMKAIQAEADLA